MSTYTPEPSAKTSTAIVPMAPPAKVLVREPTEAEIAAIVVSKGFAMMLIASYKKEVATSIASKLRTREGKLLYQSAAFSLPLFACSAAEAICPASLLQAGTKASVLMWKPRSARHAARPSRSIARAARRVLCVPGGSCTKKAGMCM